MSLSPKLSTARVLPLFRFAVEDWRNDQESVLQSIADQPWSSAGPLIVRSSAKGEDSATQSLAGQFTSVLHVLGRRGIVDAVEQVIESYGISHREDEVLVQPELENARFSGVAFNCDPNSGAPYRVISWYEGTDTTKVTPGSSEDVETWVGVIHRVPSALPPALRPLLELLDELEALTGEHRFEVEFGVDANFEVILLQARPLVIASPEVSIQRHIEVLEGLEDALTRVQSGTQFAGTRMFSTMTDWNPAEMIGEKPRPLAASLYRFLITDQTWCASRQSYGYRDLRGVPLMVDLGGLHYIDVLASINSFAPSAVSEGLVRRLSEYYSAKLMKSPELHDKIEFEVVYTCNAFGLDDDLAELRSAGFTQSDTDELSQALINLTNEVIRGDATWRRDRRLIEESKTLQSSDLGDALTLCRDTGAFPFAGLARAGFVGRKLTLGLVRAGVLSSSDVELLMGGLHTVTQEMIADLQRLAREDFLGLYGHLRPGTYDICAASYAEDPERYFEGVHLGEKVVANVEPFQLNDAQERAIALMMARDHIGGTPHDLINFIQSSMRDREWGKFEYSRQISHLLSLLIDFADELNISRDDLSYLPIESILTHQRSGDSSRDALARLIEVGRAQYEVTSSILLPSLIRTADDVYDFLVPRATPNFVTKLRVIARVADVERGDDVDGAIALISSADPGFDWLFTAGIVGLITAYGGVNSHMAIRAQELGIPTATGVGPNRFASYRMAHSIELDCAAGFIRVTR